MKGFSFWVHSILALLCGMHGIELSAEEIVTPPPPAPVEIVISVKDQKLALLEGGGVGRKFPISTSKFGLGDRYGSYQTPLGELTVCDKIGDALPSGAVLKHRNATGEILPVNAAGRDPIVTRILWLDGQEERNANARARGIYIHGTVEENRLGEAVSYGCIRMKSQDVIELFAATPIGTPVRIIEEKLPRFRKPAPVKPETELVKSERLAPPPSVAVPATHTPPPRALKLFGEKVSGEKAAAPSPAGLRHPAHSAYVPRGAILLAEAREPAPPRRGERARTGPEVTLHGAMLFADLPKKTPSPAPSPPPAQTPEPWRGLSLRVTTGSTDIFASNMDLRLQAPSLDALSAHLLEAPAPVRIAFRTRRAADVLSPLAAPRESNAEGHSEASEQRAEATTAPDTSVLR